MFPLSARNPRPEIKKLSERGAIHLIQRDYKAGDLKDALIAIACTDMKEVNRKVADEAKKAGVLVNVADDPERSDFITPSFFKRGNLTVAVSTAGVSPALARKIRTKLEKSFGEEYASLLSLIGEVRSALKKKGYMGGHRGLAGGARFRFVDSAGAIRPAEKSQGYFADQTGRR